jgi:hypothetical protein
METKISSGTIVKSQVKVVRSLECKMKIDNELIIGLLQNVGLNNSVL